MDKYMDKYVQDGFRLNKNVGTEDVKEQLELKLSALKAHSLMTPSII